MVLHNSWYQVDPCFLETAVRRKVIADVKSQKRNCARRKMRRARKRPRLTSKHGQTTEGAREVANISGQRRVSGNVKIRLKTFAGRQLRKKKSKEQPARSPKHDKKRSSTRPQQLIGNWSVRPEQVKEQRKQL